MLRRWPLLLLIAWVSVAAAPLAGQIPIDSATPTRDPRFEATVREVASSLRCPVCQNNSVEDSPSLLAQDMKKEIRARLAAGETPDQVRKYFVSRYGEWVLTKPTAGGFNLSIWLLPFVALLAGALVVWVAVRRWVRQGDAPRPAAASGEATPGDGATLRARKAALQASLQDLEAEFAAGRLDARDLALLTERDQTELNAVNEALRNVKKESTKPAARASQPVSGFGRWSARLGWAVALGAFALVLVLSLRGSVAARSEGGVITGSQTASAAPVEMELQQTGPLDSLRIAQLEARIRRDSTDVPALIELGHIYLAQGMLQKAWLVDTLAIRLQPDAPSSAEAFVHIGMILWSQGETDGGLKAIDKALYLRPELPEALLYRGIIYFAGLQDMRAAAQIFEHYLAVAPPDANTARVRAMLNAARQAGAGK